MNISRMVSDFGNSMNQHLIEGFYLEFPSSVSEISRDEVPSLFSSAVTHKDLINEMVIRVSFDGVDRYFKVGHKAKKDVLGNTHIFQLHDKTTSDSVIVTWLAAIISYHVHMHPDLDRFAEDEATIDYFSTLLPVWLLKRSGKFKDMLDKMAARFSGNFEVELMTPEFERTLFVRVLQAECRIEGETARLALKHDLELNMLDTAERYEDCYTVITDLGGQTQDISRIPPGLSNPSSSDAFASFTDQSYLLELENLRSKKMMQHFKSIRTLEHFIMDNINQGVFIYTNPTTGEQIDYTEDIESMIKKYVKIAVDKTVQAFSFDPGESVKFVWIGGVTELLKPYIQAYIQEIYPEEVGGIHIFPENSRKLNLYALEIVAKFKTIVKGKTASETSEERTV